MVKLWEIPLRAKELQLEEKFVEVLDIYLLLILRSQDLPPTWKEIAKALRTIGYEKMVVDIMITGHDIIM